jgi:hypothetical protein
MLSHCPSNRIKMIPRAKKPKQRTGLDAGA